MTFSGELFAALQETILITFNYRHDLFATLYLEGELNANIQLFDQNLALRWIKKYIGELCGNADRLTVFGHSMGARSLGYHLLSSYSKNLISNAILQSSAPFFQDSLPATKDELAINSLLAVIELRNCTNFTDLKLDQISGLSEKVKANYFDRQAMRYSLKKEILLENLLKIHHKFSQSKLVPNKENIDLSELVRFLAKHVDVACLQRLSKEQVANVSSMYMDAKWSYYVDNDFIRADTYYDYKLFNKLDLNPNLNLLIGNVIEEDQSDTLWLLDTDRYYSDQFNPPVIPKEEIIEIIAKNLSFLTSGKFFLDFFQNS